MSKVSPTQSKIKASPQPNFKLSTTKKRNSKKKNNNKPLFLALFTQTPKSWEVEEAPTVMTQMTKATQPTLFALTLSRDSVRREKNVFTRTIWHWTETKKSIFMWIKESN